MPSLSPAVSPAELEARLRLHSLPQLGPRRFRRLLEAFSSASAALSAPASAWRALGLPACCAEARRSSAVREQAAATLLWLEQPQQQLLMWDDPAYPALLAELRIISDAWLTAKKSREKGFSVGRFDADWLNRWPLALVRCDGRLVAFANVLTNAQGDFCLGTA